MTQGLLFLFSILIKGAVAALLGGLLWKRLQLSRFGASVRTGCAAMIGTGVTHPVIWLGFSRFLEWPGTWWGAATVSVAGVALAETLFYAAALRGHWRWSFALSVAVNVAAFGAGLLVTSWLPRST